MSEPLAVLMVEDSGSDAAMVTRLLERAGHAVHLRRVESEEEMREALAAQNWDVVISDYNVPQFEAPAVLALVLDTGLDIPFIVVSGTVGEETAVELMRAGAQDYVRKENLSRLAPAVAREVAEARDRARRRHSETALRESETQFQTLVELAPEAVFIQTGGCFAYVNGAAQQLFGARSAEELIGRSVLDLFRADQHEQISARIRMLNEDQKVVPSAEEVCVRLDGSTIDVEVSAAPFQHQGEHGAIVFARNITERKRAESSLRDQMEELRRWHKATLGREARILDLKQEVNRLLAQLGQHPHYPSAGEDPGPLEDPSA